MGLDNLVRGGTRPYTYRIVTYAPGAMSIASDGRTLLWAPSGLAVGESRTAQVLVTDSSSPTRLSALIDITCTVLPEPPPVLEVVGPFTGSILGSTRRFENLVYQGFNGTTPYTWSASITGGASVSLSSTTGSSVTASGTVPATASEGDQYRVTVTLEDSDATSGPVSLETLLTVVDEVIPPTATCAGFSIPAPGASDSNTVVIANDPGGARTFTVTSGHPDFTAVVSTSGVVTVTASATAPRNTFTDRLSGTVTFSDGTVASWTSSARIQCIDFTARGGSISLEAGTSGSVTIDVFGGCPGITHHIARETGDVDPSFATFTLSGATVTVAVTAGATSGSSHTAYYNVFPSIGAQQRVGITVTVIAANPVVTAPDIVVPPGRTRTGQASVRNPGGPGAWSVQNAASRPSWLAALAVNQDGLVSARRGTGGDGETFDYILRWTPTNTSIPADDDVGTITAGLDTISITGSDFQAYRGESATQIYTATGGTGTYTEVEVTTSGDHTGVSIRATLGTSGDIFVTASSTGTASNNTRYRFGLRVTDSAGTVSDFAFFHFRVRCAAVSVTSPNYPGQQPADDVTVTFQRFGGCTAGTWRLVGSYTFEVSALTVSGDTATCTVEVPTDAVSGGEYKVTAEYTDGTESDNSAQGTATISIGDPFTFDLPARFDVSDYGLQMNRNMNAYVEGAVAPFSVSIVGQAPPGVTLTASPATNFARGIQGTYVLRHSFVSRDVQVTLRARDNAGRSVEKTTTLGIGPYSCNQLWDDVGAATTGFIGFYLFGRKSENEELFLDVPDSQAHLVRVAPQAETQWDAALVALRLTLDDIGTEHEFTVNIINDRQAENPTVLGTCSGSYNVVPIFELSFTQKAIKHGSTATLVITSFPPTSDPRVDRDSIRVSAIDPSTGRTPEWIEIVIGPLGSPISLRATPPIGIDLRHYNLDIGVRANFDFGDISGPRIVDFHYVSPANEFILQRTARVTIGVVDVDPLRIVCRTNTVSVEHGDFFGGVTRTVAIAANQAGNVSWSWEVGVSPPPPGGIVLGSFLPRADRLNYRLSGAEINLIASDMLIRGLNIAIMRLDIKGRDPFSEDSCKTNITFIRQE